MKISIQLAILLAGIIFSGCNPSAGNASGETDKSSDSTAVEPSSTPVQTQTAPDMATKSEASKPDSKQLTGDWLRTDGGKTIRIKNAMPDGKLDAEYFNPKSIHVGRAEWLAKNNSLVVIVELQDVNYPGSRYTLEYFPAEDELAGIYYQAVEKASYDVGFVRQR